MNPSVSIIVPNYNHDAFLRQRLESIFNQTYKDFEAIILDDASTDDSVAILKRYANHPKISHLIINESNSGSPFKQWEKGINLAKGEFVWIAESDDFCDVKFLEKILEQFNEDTVLAYCASYMISLKGEILGLDPWSEGVIDPKWKSSYHNNGLKEIQANLRFANTIPNASAVIFRKEVALQAGFPIGMKFCGDWWFWIQMLKLGDVAFFKEPLNYFRTHPNTTRTIKEKHSEIIRFREYFLIVKETSHIGERVTNRRFYKWILLEWNSKRKILDGASVLKADMPMDFLFIYFVQRLKYIFFTYRSRIYRNLKKMCKFGD